IAPYRAFLQHRQHHGAKGNNWLVFGDRTMRSDFLYQQELLRWRRDGLLTELDVAFSRDQAEKHYVQHRLVERGDDVYKWMEAGAHFYVCGDADRMAPDVHAALLQVIAQHGNRDADAATAYLEQMRKAGRYQRDVY
ncbi:MAG: hypothetical protein KJO35_09345, partial [Gammaproteobacteria bacterium]|nr:hypothetical protein [Gammaproteobacteria bacterium]